MSDCKSLKMSGFKIPILIDKLTIDHCLIKIILTFLGATLVEKALKKNIFNVYVWGAGIFLGLRDAGLAP